ncbi:MAG: SDR family oxidoreductase [Myxococcota bacterium]|nr:SDR family oxidoreductase [Myxococcota bacterium]
MSGKRVVVTGANSGIGWSTACALAEMGAELVLVCRSKPKGLEAIDRIKTVKPDAAISLFRCDLSSQEEIQTLCGQLRNAYEQIDVLVNNAGVYLAEKRETRDGLEQTFAVNHMAYFLMCRGLLSCLKAARSGRIVNVSSFGHRLGSIDLDDVNYERRRYSPMGAYCASKLMNIQFTRHLASRLVDDQVTVNCLHPGMVRSGFAVSQKDAFALLTRMAGAFLVSPQRGARTSIHLATNPDVAQISGQYFRNRKVVKPSGKALDSKQAEQLWQLSESLIRHDPLMARMT